jgi:hypothetical protein
MRFGGLRECGGEAHEPDQSCDLVSSFSMASEELRRTSRVRKTPTKFAQDYDVLDASPAVRTPHRSLSLTIELAYILAFSEMEAQFLWMSRFHTVFWS